MAATGFLAYPFKPPEIGKAVTEALGYLRNTLGVTGFTGWETNDIAGSFVGTPIFENIRSTEILVADITKLNFNVVYEVGYAIGSKKRVMPVENTSIANDNTLIREVGIFDTIGYETYDTSAALAKKIAGLDPNRVLPFDLTRTNKSAPLYIIWPPKRTNYEVHLLSRIKKTGLRPRQYDPDEVGRMPAPLAIQEVAASLGIVIPLLPSNRLDSTVHNFRCAFVAGLAEGMGKITMMLQPGFEPVPVDYRDLVSVFINEEQVVEYLQEFTTAVTEELQKDAPPVVAEAETFLATLSLGSAIAENELRDLHRYYLTTDEFQKAINGEVQLIVGRKGAGKTALFASLRDKLRKSQKMVVLDLQPEGYQLLKFRQQVLDLLDIGTKEHTITAFWEYVLLLEICHKLLEKDRALHVRNHDLYEPYQELAAAAAGDDYVREGDFAERMLTLIDAVATNFQEHVNGGAKEVRLSNAQVTELIYKHDVPKLRKAVHNYLALKEGVWVLFDNLDKGWPASGLGRDDVIIVRTLIEAINKLRNSLSKQEVECNGIVFLRNDVFDLLVNNTSDRGKVSRATIDWTDPELLREMLRRRFVFSGADSNGDFYSIWKTICISHYKGEESSQYLIDRCLMRPRSLIELVNACKSNAVTFGKEQIDADDIKEGEESYSSALVSNTCFDMRDVIPEIDDVLYIFLGSSRRVNKHAVVELLSKKTADANKILELLLWSGVIGVVRANDEVAYIYNVRYDYRRLKALMDSTASGNPVFEINPAFWVGLEVK